MGSFYSIRIAAVLSAIFLVAGCAVSTGEAPSRPPAGEWKTSAPPESAAKPITHAALEWKGITPGVTNRSEVDARFHPLKQTAENVSLYRIDQIDTAIAYGPADKVHSIRLPPALDLSRDQVTEKFGTPTAVLPLEGRGNALDYQAVGVSIEYPYRGGSPAAVDLRTPAGLPGRSELQLFDTVVPIRPPLTDIRARVRAVDAALATTPEGFSWVSIEHERGQAEQFYAELGKRGLLINAPELQNYVDGLMTRVASVTPLGAEGWKLTVMKGPVPNAMNIGGGYVFITQGMIEQVQTESQLAYVVAHEMAHQLKGDVRSAQTKAQIAGLLVIAGAIAVGAATGSSDLMRATAELGGVAAEATLAPFSRAQEHDADMLALEIVSEAGYDPREAAQVMGSMKVIRDKYGADIAILSSHPAIEMREEDIRGWLDAHQARDYSSALVTTQEFIAIRRQYRVNPW